MDKEIIPCYEQALRFLSIREHNRFELIAKLKQKSFDQEIIDKTISCLLDNDYLSEERYIRVFISSNNRKHPEGKQIVLARLSQKGADRNLSKEIVNSVYTYDYTQELINEAVKKFVKKQKTEEMRNKLLKLGFLSADIKENFSNRLDTD